MYIFPVGHVLKVTATAAGSPDKTKVFVNICHNEALGKPSHEKKKQSNGAVGLQWSIPHSFRYYLSLGQSLPKTHREPLLG